MADLSPYVGLEFVEHGRSREGIDCWGLVVLLYRDLLGIKLPAYDTGYSHTGREDGDSIAAIIDRHRPEWWPIAEGSEQFGDLINLKIWDRPMHIGFVFERGRMLHAIAGVGSCVGRYNDREWRLPNKVVGFYRHAEIARGQDMGGNFAAAWEAMRQR